MSGQVHIYTGNGKGKTTAALGMVMRASAYGWPIYIAQFMKGQHYGELDSLQLFSNVKLEQFGSPDLIHVQIPPREVDVDAAKAGMAAALEAIKSGKYRMVILDEINVAHYFHLISTEDIIELIKQRPPELELVLTGRYAPVELYDYADLVTEMREIKHYYSKGVPARDGIER